MLQHNRTLFNPLTCTFTDNGDIPTPEAWRPRIIDSVSRWAKVDATRLWGRQLRVDFWAAMVWRVSGVPYVRVELWRKRRIEPRYVWTVDLFLHGRQETDANGDDWIYFGQDLLHCFAKPIERKETRA